MKENSITVDSTRETEKEKEKAQKQKEDEKTVNKRTEQEIFLLRDPGRIKKGKTYSLSGDGDMEDSIGDTLHFSGPLSYSDLIYLRTVTKEMREIDVEIQRAQENGNPEKAEKMANLWEQKRTSLIIYLKKNKIRICPMKQKNKEKIWDKAEEKEARDKKQKANVHLKNRDHGYGRERMRNWE